MLFEYVSELFTTILCFLKLKNNNILIGHFQAQIVVKFNNTEFSNPATNQVKTNNEKHP